jgi:hypothetical protein
VGYYCLQRKTPRGNIATPQLRGINLPHCRPRSSSGCATVRLEPLDCPPSLPVADHRESYGREPETFERVEQNEPDSATTPGNQKGGSDKTDRAGQCDASLGSRKKDYAFGT